MKLYNQKKNTLFKKVISVFLCLCLMIPICGIASLVGSCNAANLSAEREVRPGNSYVVRLILDSAATGYEGYFSYDSSILTLTKIAPVNSGLFLDFQVTTETGYVRVTHSEPVKQMLQLTFLIDADAKTNAEAWVRFYDGTVIEGDKKQTVEDESFHFLVVDTKSSDASLRALEVSVYRSLSDRDQDDHAFLASLAPSFSASHSTYSLTVAGEFAYFRIVATPNDSTAAVISVSDGELKEGAVNTVHVVVQAEDGTQMTYVLQIFRERLYENSIEVSYPESEDPSDDTSEELSELPSYESSEDASSNLEESEESVISEPQNASDDSTNDTTTEESSLTESLADSTELSSVSSAPIASSSAQAQTDSTNWKGVFFCIAAVGILAIAVLMIRIFILIHKKRKG